MSRASRLNRYDFILNKHLESAWRRARLEKQDQQLAVEREERIFAIIAHSDPTKEGKYLAWLASWRQRHWSEFGLRTMCSSEDLAALRKGLEHFHAILPRLPVPFRGVNAYETAQELMDARQPLPMLQREANRVALRIEAHQNSSILFDGNGWILVRLNGRPAAIWWGKGTRWCTAGREAGHFERYSAFGQLLVIVGPRDKYQLWTHDMEFRDSTDARADFGSVVARSPEGLKTALAACLTPEPLSSRD